jgi:hypothetical protein
MLLHWNCIACHDEVAYPLAASDVVQPTAIGRERKRVFFCCYWRYIYSLNRAFVEPFIEP